ncbi:tripartite tricarboxylate transporter TctB family protein [uncultured Sphaerochaeta sp.]|uniref:tripartite tricarboxylate transporter TctB family protein n=1 Tax=uncultured Sphaerochaeta sp. TaxID=886478 RepID=UPI002A0A2E3A|nr:tripartite tricarboxylate transporter TctB family protein [uncultured Sphaerochaeta sp.]
MKLKRDQIAGVLLILLGLVVFIIIQQFDVKFSLSYPGPKFLPGLAAIGFFICGAGIFVSSTLNKRDEKTFLLKEGWLRLVFSLILLCVYVLMLKYFGYLLITPIFTYVIVTLFAHGKPTKTINRIIFSILVSLIIYFIYSYIFKLPLPSGLLFE